MPGVINTKTTYLFDVENLRKVFASEKALRGLSFNEIQLETGINFTQLASFAAGTSGLGIHALVTVAKWTNADLRSFVVRQRQASKHVPSPQERELRNLNKYLEAAGFKVDADENPVELAVRLLAQAKDLGAFDA